MTPSVVSPAPANDTLERVLAAALGDLAPVRVIERSPNSYESTFPSEILTCSVGADTIEVLCKYDLPWARDVHGRRAGPVYEADVYRFAVTPSRLPAPRCFGISFDPGTGARWLMVEHLARGVRVNKATSRSAIVRAAEWIGSFHRFHETAGQGSPERLNRHDGDYFAACAERALANSASVAERYPWIDSLTRCFEAEFVPRLLRRPTVIHGEFYPENVLIERGVVYPVDWERSAASAGEIDLAALTEGHWTPRIVEKSIDAYAQARWQDGRPTGFESTLEAARIYLHIRALGDEPSEPFGPRGEWRFEQLRRAAERLGLT